MRSLIVSDIHSNDFALRAVLARVRRKRIDRLICLGDFVGYGAQPNQVLDRLRTFPAKKLFIRGNHDRVVSGASDGSEFNHAARTAALWTRGRISRTNLRFLRTLPLGPVAAGNLLLCHGSPLDEDEYLFSVADAETAMRKTAAAAVVLFGHTHLPVVFELTGGEVEPLDVRGGATIRLRNDCRYLINPGSVGQPRDRSPLASFAILDDAAGTIQFLRVLYDVERAREAILAAGLPPVLGDRLRYGT